MERLPVFQSSNEFKVDKEANSSTCNTCGKVLAGTQKYNNFRHLKLNHQEVAARYDHQEVSPNKRQGKPSKAPAKKCKIEIEMDKEEFKQTCVEMVATEACAYRLMDRPTFKKLVAPYEKAYGVTVNSKNAKVWVRDEAENIRKLISDEFRNKMFSIKLDLASRYGHSVLGVNAQIITKTKIVVRTLGMVGMNRRHTATNIVDEIRALLALYGLGMEQVYSWTSDNAANMIAASNELAESLLQTLNELRAIQRRLLDQENADEDGENELDPKHTPAEDEEEEYLDESEDVCDEEEEEEEKMLEELENDSCFTCFRCVVHTINLGIGVVLKKPTFSKPLSEIRSQVKRLKSVIFGPVFKLNKIKTPKVDCVTRWGSAYTMVESFVNLQGIADQLKVMDKSLKLTKELFDFGKKFCTGFEPVQKLMKNLQQQQLTAGDFFKYYWVVARNELMALDQSNDLAKALLLALEARKEHLFGNPAFKAALYFDPRINFKTSVYLTPKDKKDAVAHIMRTRKTLQIVKGTCNESSSVDPDPSEELSEYDKFIVQECSMSEDSDQNVSTTRDANFLERLNNLCFQPRLSIAKNVLEYWATQESIDPELFEISQIVLAAPVTSVSVERAFNALTHILTAPRTNIDANNLEDILLVRLNQELLS